MATLSSQKLGALAALVFLGCGGTAPKALSPHEQAKPTQEEALPWRVAELKDPQLHTTAEGRRFEIVPVDSSVDDSLVDRYLVRMTGTQGDFEGVVLLAELMKHSSFRTSIGGEPRYLLYRDKVPGGESAWFYNSRQHPFERVLLTTGDGQEVDGEALLQRYAKQELSGLNEKLAPTDRPTRERLQQASVDATLADPQQTACGPLSMSIDWSTVEDEWFDEFSIADACRKDLGHLLDFCSSFPNRLPEVHAASEMGCAFSGHPSQGDRIMPTLTRAGGLHFVPRRKRAARKAGAHLRKLFGEQQQVLRGKNVYFIARDEPDGRRRIYNGDGKTFYPAARLGGDTYNLTNSIEQASVKHRNGDWLLACGAEREKLQFLEGKERDSILETAVFENRTKWPRRPDFLARDTRGVYYYVDRLKDDHGGKGYRVFVGRRGSLKLSKLKGIVDDSSGRVFSTDEGNLRLVINQRKPEAFWIKGRKNSELIVVKTSGNQALIYDELGAYFGEDLGFVCDK